VTVLIECTSMSRSKTLQIAIDGPVAAGKSTVARKLAERLKIMYVDTGAMYRTTALLAQREGVSWNDEAGLESLLKQNQISLQMPADEEKDGRLITVKLNNEDLSWAIRTQEVAEGASVVSQYPKVRQILVEKQQEMAKVQAVVMEGRDIGTRVLPKAPLKIFMTADVDKRVNWKQKQMAAQGQELTKEEVRQALIKRDEREMNRKTDPLRPAKNAWILDTSNLNLEEVVEVIVEKVNALGY
jgi:CMP/dCMP kinase